MKSKVKPAWILCGFLSIAMPLWAQTKTNQKSDQPQNAVKMEATKKQDAPGRAAFPYEKKFQMVDGVRMAYVETGAGDPIVFLHGNPTSSYIWRNIIPHVQDLGRCIAPDLVGMGDSQKLSDPAAYTFDNNEKYLDGLLKALNVKKNIIFVVHDWGSALAFDWTRAHPDAVKGIVYMEAILRPRSWKEVPPFAQEIFQNIRSEKGEEMILQNNSFIEVNLPRTVLRPLSPEEMENYRRPFPEPGEGRRAMLSWPRQLPIENEPPHMMDVVNQYGEFMAHSNIPKLFIESTPGTLSEIDKTFCKTWPNQTHVVVPGSHNLQEDSPDEIGAAISVWVQGLD
jgi:haloalkane dehalogenase